jgi:ARC6-like, IMS domain
MKRKGDFTALGTLLLGAVGLAFAAASQSSGSVRIFSGLMIPAVTAVFAIVGLRDISDRVGRVSAVAVAVVIGVAGLTYVWSGWNQRSAAAARSNASASRDEASTAIQTTIQRAADVEASWYEHPAEDLQGRLERYYLPTRKGGTGVGKIIDQVAKFRREHCHWKVSADHTITFAKLNIAGNKATVVTHETYHQPRVCTGSSKPQAAPSDVHYDAQYELTRRQGRWLIGASGSPFAP